MTIRRGLLPLLVLLSLAGCTTDEPPPVQLAEVRRAPVTEVVEAPATVGARASATLRSPAQGTVAKLYVKDGDQVKKGEILAKIRSPQAQDQLRQARQASRMARPAPVSMPGVNLAAFDTGALDRKVAAHFAKARKEAGKVDDARVRRQLLNAIDLAQAQHRAQTKALAAITAQLNRTINGALRGMTSGLSSSMASLQAASRTQVKAAVEAAENTVESLSVKAPFAGVVTLGRASGGGTGGGLDGLLGQLPGAGQQLPALPSTGSTSGSPVAVGVPVSMGDSIVTVTDVSKLTLSADIDETDVLLVEKGTAAAVELDAVPGATYRATVTGVGVTPKEASTGGVSYPVQLTLGTGTFDDGTPAPTPKPGMSAVTRLTVRESASAIAAPAAAVVTSGRDSVVWVSRNGVAERRVVKLGAQGEAVVEVLSGLSVGDRIVVKGADSVREGQELP
ncbi:HlyD family efflux transporter periplasmic adaptor subunit [Nonomuraea sp. NN258]|uniref:efflux RND transporter periplasmic adaptor subunit n=1 Tax=Nonomuraea antri TaxID=2730852 RepID=UPI001568D734|nr:biotin/lipoyl-binding protein [Nonomuraea antri]NRQ31400.1 HlyD family efflux transporter periplasmic adaptor subunit [Nonomuraea antri]